MSTENNENRPKYSPRVLFGRRVITTDLQYVDLDNVRQLIADTIATHLANRNEIDYLYKYYKGRQPILGRTKEVRAEICNRIVENRAHQIVDFKTGYLVGEPIQYTSRDAGRDVSASLSALNSYMYSSSKSAKDKELADWQHICGTAFRLVLPSEEIGEDVVPFNIYTIDPRDAFVVYANDVTKRPLAGIYYITDRQGNKTFSIYTQDKFFEIKGEKITSVKDNPLGTIPIIEYPANETRMGVFETVLPLLDAVNNLNSNRLDGVEQFIQSLLVLYNCQLDEGTTASTIREAGLLLLKSIGEVKSDIKEISSQLDQSQTQTLKQDLLNAIITIVGMPSQGDGKGSDSSNNGAMLLKQGWQTAEARAKDSELIFRRSEVEMLKVVLRICNTLADIDLKVSDICIKFTRRNYEDINAKSTVLTTLLGTNKVAPIDAFTVCGMFPDPEEACARGLEWMNEQDQRQQERFEKQNAMAEEKEPEVEE